MPILIPIGYSKVSHFISGPSAGGSRLSVVTYGIHALPGSAECTALHNFYGAFWDEAGLSDSTLERTEMRDSTTAFEHVDPQDGGLTGDGASPQVAILVRKVSGLVGKTHRGRNYLPFSIVNDHLANTGLLDNDTVTARQTAVDTWSAAVEADSSLGPLVILHSSGLEEEPTPVNQWIVERAVATQKRRLNR